MMAATVPNSAGSNARQRAGREPAAGGGTHDERGRPAPREIEIDGAAPVVCARGRNGSRHDCCEGRGHGDLHPHDRIDTQRGQRDLEHGDDHDSAADTEQPGDESAREPGRERGRTEQPPLRHRIERPGRGSRGRTARYRRPDAHREIREAVDVRLEPVTDRERPHTRRRARKHQVARAQLEQGR